MRTLHFHHSGHGFHPCQGIKISQAERQTAKKKQPSHFSHLLNLKQVTAGAFRAWSYLGL